MLRRLQGFIIGLIASALLFGGVAFAAAELNVVPNPFPVLINGILATVEGYNVNGYTFLKLADFKQAGLTVKFNETDKQIEITSVQAVAAPSNTSGGGVAMSETLPVPLNKYGLPDFVAYKGAKPTIEDDRKNQYITFEGVRYIRLGWDKNHPPMLAHPYSMSKYKEDEMGNTIISLHSIIQTSEGEKGVTLLDEIPYTNYSFSEHYITYDYYLNTFLPLIK